MSDTRTPEEWSEQWHIPPESDWIDQLSARGHGMRIFTPEQWDAVVGVVRAAEALRQADLRQDVERTESALFVALDALREAVTN